MINLATQTPDRFPFRVIFERVTSTFANNSQLHDSCEFLTVSQVAFTPVTVADSLEIVSTSADDTSAGIGTRTVEIVYLDAAGLWLNTIVTMNGTTPVSVPITASAIISMQATTGGTNEVSVGRIDLRNVATPTTIYEQIAAGGNKSQSGRFRCPTGYYAMITGYTLSVIGQACETKIRIKRSTFDGRNIDRYLFHTNVNLAANSTIAVNESIRFDAGQDMKISGQIAATTGSPRVYGTIQLELVKI